MDEVIELCRGSVVSLGIKKSQRRLQVLESFLHRRLLHRVWLNTSSTGLSYMKAAWELTGRSQAGRRWST